MTTIQQFMRDGIMHSVNFFWRGDKFSYLHRLCVLSHLKVGHKPTIWLSGERPRSKYWISDIKGVTIKNANQIFDVTNFLSRGANLKTASDLWRFNFLYEHGGLYCDLDALAIKEFPDDDFILCSALPDHPKEKISIGVIKVPPKEIFIKEAIENIKEKWGNVTVFGDSYEKHYGHSNSSHNDKLFYPYTWEEWNKLFMDIEIPECYSLHIYHTMLERNNMVKTKEEYLKMKNTLIYKLIDKFDGE